MWKDVGKFLAKNGAPLLGGVLGGPAGAAIGQMVASKITGDPDASPELVLSQFTQTPETLLKAKELELDHKERLIELRLEGEKIRLEEAKVEMQDRVSARQREMDFIKATGKKDMTLTILAWTVIGGFFTLSAMLFYVDVSGSNEVIFVVLGTLGTGFGTVLNYYFGSSKGSKDKDQALANKKEAA